MVRSILLVQFERCVAGVRGGLQADEGALVGQGWQNEFRALSARLYRTRVPGKRILCDEKEASSR